MDQKFRILIAVVGTPLAIWLFHSFAKFITDLVHLLPQGPLRRFLLWRSKH